MVSPRFNPSQPEFIKELLQPLLEDFQYWFSRSRTLLESQRVGFLDEDQQSELLCRVIQAQQEVETAKMMLEVTNGQVGLDTNVLMPWHHLVTECWQVGMRFRAEQANFKNLSSDSRGNLRD
jgi:hypothetical protein